MGIPTSAARSGSGFTARQQMDDKAPARQRLTPLKTLARLMSHNPLSVSEAAKALGVTPGRIRQMILAGRLKATKVGSFWIIQPEDLEAVRYRRPGRPRKEK